MLKERYPSLGAKGDLEEALLAKANACVVFPQDPPWFGAAPRLPLEERQALFDQEETTT